MAGTLYITGDTDADALLNEDGTALLVGIGMKPEGWTKAAKAAKRDEQDRPVG